MLLKKGLADEKTGKEKNNKDKKISVNFWERSDGARKMKETK